MIVFLLCRTALRGRSCSWDGAAEPFSTPGPERRLTGQNPASAAVLGERLLMLLQ
ncbi:hypothetical protein ACWEGX_21910 [Streptomyces chartreusis]|uniref:hypothetical protein n=1 Tax=Streptomyces TaxID=1883 RepID=UPI00163B68DE|nr:hypothetical protein [Streptomyces sp. WAC 01325]